jgi:hypothetical protein
MRREDAASCSQRAISLLQTMIRTASESFSLKEDALMALSAVIEGMKDHAAEAIPYIKDDIIKAIDNAAHGAVSCGADCQERKRNAWIKTRKGEGNN